MNLDPHESAIGGHPYQASNYASQVPTRPRPQIQKTQVNIPHYPFELGEECRPAVYFFDGETLRQPAQDIFAAERRLPTVPDNASKVLSSMGNAVKRAILK